MAASISAALSMTENRRIFTGSLSEDREVKSMRHIYIRGIIGLIWLVAAIVCGISGDFPMMGLYIVLAGAFLYSAYAAWKKEKDGKGGR